MFEAASLGHKVDAATFAQREKKLRADLLDTQFALKECGQFPVVVLINGLDGAGKGETVNLLNEWMDPRHIHTHAFGPPTQEEAERPPMWRFWRALPPKGSIGILFGNWYTDAIMARMRGGRKSALRTSLADIRHFERMLTEEGVVLVKLWFHLSKKGQEKRLTKLAANPLTAWRVTKHDWKLFKDYDRFVGTAEEALSETSTGFAPWTLIDGSNDNHRALAVGEHLLAVLQAQLAVYRKTQRETQSKAQGKAKASTRAATKTSPAPAQLHTEALDGRNLLNSLDLGQRLSDQTYERELEKWQGRLNQLARDAKFRERSAVLVFEGMDAAGKGGAIRRVTAALDARNYVTIPVAAPTDTERAQPYLWRFWQHVPGHGRFAIFDRSWYGRVLVERVEGFCKANDWQRAYNEINEFERQLAANGSVVAKFWLSVSQEEQLRRFKERETTRFKRFKITPDDWRNRDKWPLYEAAVCDMIERTSTPVSAWHLIAAEDKKHARIAVLKALCEQIDSAL